MLYSPGPYSLALGLAEVRFSYTIKTCACRPCCKFATPAALLPASLPTRS